MKKALKVIGIILLILVILLAATVAGAYIFISQKFAKTEIGLPLTMLLVTIRF